MPTCQRRREFNNASARRRSLFWYLYLLELCKALYQCNMVELAYAWDIHANGGFILKFVFISPVVIENIKVKTTNFNMSPLTRFFSMHLQYPVL